MTKTANSPARQPRSLREYLDGPPAVGQRALAEAAGCNQSMISMLVRGKRVPSARLAVKLHAITGVPLKMLLASRMEKKVQPPKKRRHPAGRGDPAARQHVSP
jgi:transcriptional regulator with XRE-family HTH domain